jgi:polar amino acid transport system substrate-binding protein
LLFPLAGAGCGLPRDPEDTLERVRGGTLRVGVVHNPPWAVVKDREVTGVEVELVKKLAAELHARVEWFPGTESQLLRGLEHFELAIVIGGVDESTPWKGRIALTGSYYDNEFIIGVGPGAPLPSDIDGLKVVYLSGDVVAATRIREEGGKPVAADDPPAQELPVAAEAWRIRQWGLQPAGIELDTRKLVLALPPGENAWLLHVERFLRRHRHDVPGLLEGPVAR